MIDVELFVYFELVVDVFCNYYVLEKNYLFFVEVLVECVDLLNLLVLEMIVLLGGLCLLDVNYKGVKYGVFIDKLGILSNDFFINLLDMGIVWSKIDKEGVYEGCDCSIGKVKWIVIFVDLIFGLNIELCVIVEVYVVGDVNEKFVKDFVVVWIKVM